MGSECLVVLVLGRPLGVGGFEKAEVPAVLVVEASRHSTAELQPVLLVLPHLLPLSVAWPGGLSCPWNRGTVDTAAC